MNAGELLEPLGGLEDGLEPLEGQPDFAFGGSQGGLSHSQASEESGAAALQALPGQLEAGEAALGDLLAACADASGSLSAADSAAYVTSWALQQCQQQQAAHAAELAAFEWLHEEMLPPDQLPAQLAVPITAAVAAAAGSAAASSPAEAASWALSMPRRHLLQGIQAAVNTLLSLEAPLQQWGRSRVKLQRQLEEEISAAMPYLGPQLRTVLAAQQKWLDTAAAHAGSLTRLGQAVLLFESSRAATQSTETAAAEPWQRYAALVLGMQQLETAHAAAEAGVVGAAGELEQLSVRRAEAVAIQQTAGGVGKAAAAQFAANALALVKATQALTPALRNLLPTLGSCEAQAAVLQQVRQQLASFSLVASRRAGSQAAGSRAAAPATEHTLLPLQQRCAAAEQGLDAGAELLAALPSSLDALYQQLLPVRNKLLAGGRGEAAARQQATEVIDGLASVLTEVQPQVKIGAVGQATLGPVASPTTCSLLICNCWLARV